MGAGAPALRHVRDAAPAPGGLPEDQELSGAGGDVPRRPVAAFDLDGTLTRRDTLLPFLLRAFGRWRTGRAVFASSLLLARALTRGGTRRDTAKAAVLRRLLASEPTSRLAELAEAYADDVVAGRLRPEMRRLVEWHREAGHELVIVSASPELYVVPLGRRLGFDHVLATRLEADGEGRLTGRLLGANCRGAEKAARLSDWLGDDRALAFAYGDSAGDEEMLALAETAVRVRRGRRIAGGNG